MRTLLLANAMALAFAVPPLASQQFVTNGDFSAGLTGWTQNGYTCMSGVQSLDVNGRGTNNAFWCMPGGQVTPPPYPPNTLEQNVLGVPGPTYEFSCDLLIYRPTSTGTNVDAGTIFVTVGTQEILRQSFGSIVLNETKRARLHARFVYLNPGQQQLVINFQRAFLCSTSATTPTPHNAIDNVSLRIATGPTFGMVGNLKIGTSVTARANGAPSAPFALFAAANELPSGLSVPGIGGTLFLDPVSLVLVFTGSLDATGVWQASIAVPADPALTMLPTFFQGIHVASGTGTLGYHSGYVFVP